MMADGQRCDQQIVPKGEEQKRRIEYTENKQATAAKAEQPSKGMIEKALHASLDTKPVIFSSFEIEDVC